MGFGNSPEKFSLNRITLQQSDHNSLESHKYSNHRDHTRLFTRYNTSFLYILQLQSLLRKTVAILLLNTRKHVMPGAIVENDRGHGSKRHCSSTNEPETGTSKELQISGEAGISPVTHCQYVDGKAIRRLGSSSNIRGEDEAPAIPLWEFPGIWGRFVRSLFEVIRPRVQPGYRRIEWVCVGLKSPCPWFRRCQGINTS